MRSPHSVCEVLREHVALESECIDRMYQKGTRDSGRLTFDTMHGLDDLEPLPEEWKPLRDELRARGQELVRYTRNAARRDAQRVRHPSADYEYGLHKVFGIYPPKVRIYRDATRRLAADQLPHLAESCRNSDSTPSTGEAIKNFVKQPEHVVLGVVVLPYVLSLLGLGLFGLRQHRRHEAWVRSQLQSLDDTPVLYVPHRRSPAQG